MPDSFQFLHPEWLLALFPLAGLLWALRNRSRSSPWQQVVDPQLLPLLLSSEGGKGGGLVRWLLAAGWVIAVIALANPVWDKQSRPVFQSTAARVIVLDLSQSMNAADLKPSRMARARFKVADMLAREQEGQTGLVVFAGDAFVVAPLTRDTQTLDNLLKALEPLIMPVQGSRVDLGLRKAMELMRQAGVKRGEVLLVTDGFAGDRPLRMASELKQAGYRIEVLGVGTEQGAPVPDGQGGLLRDVNGKVVIAGLTAEALQRLARLGGGRYATITSNDGDLDRLLHNQGDRRFGSDREQAEQRTKSWNEQGPKLVVLLLPLAALAFRRGWLLSLLLVIGGGLPPTPALAFSWQDLWQRPDQQAAKALQRGDMEHALALAKDPARRGTAQYRQGDYPAALQAFANAPGADAAYNRGNALARLGDYQAAIKAYDQALRQRPDLQDAAYNKALVEQRLQQQKQQQQGAQGQEGSQQEQRGGADGDPSSQSEDGGQQRSDGAKGGEQADASAQRQPPDAKGQPRAGSADQGETDQDRQQAGGQGEEDSNPASQQEQTAAAESGNGKDDKDNQENTFAQAVEQAGRASDESFGPRRMGQNPNHGDAADAVPDQHRTAAKGPSKPGPADVDAEPLGSEEQLAAERWLRRIPDDPGGLLRRKFLYQYSRRPSAPGVGGDQPW